MTLKEIAIFLPKTDGIDDRTAIEPIECNRTFAIAVWFADHIYLSLFVGSFAWPFSATFNCKCACVFVFTIYFAFYHSSLLFMHICVASAHHGSFVWFAVTAHVSFSYSSLNPFENNNDGGSDDGIRHCCHCDSFFFTNISSEMVGHDAHTLCIYAHCTLCNFIFIALLL